MFIEILGAFMHFSGSHWSTVAKFDDTPAGLDAMEQLAAMGVPEEQAQALLEATGGDVEMAINLFFADDVAMAPAAGAPELPEGLFQLVWGDAAEVPQAWREQHLRFQEAWELEVKGFRKAACMIMYVFIYLS